MCTVDRQDFTKFSTRSKTFNGWSHFFSSPSSTSDCFKAQRPDCHPREEHHLSMQHHRKPSTCHLLAERGQPGKNLEQGTSHSLIWKYCSDRDISEISVYKSRDECIWINLLLSKKPEFVIYVWLGFCSTNPVNKLSFTPLCFKGENDSPQHKQVLSDLIRLFLTLFLGGCPQQVAHRTNRREANKRVQHICIWLREMSTDKVLEGIAVKRWRGMFLLFVTTV